ncbi:putative baseplate assembly protein [Nostoc sp. NMS9]|uniref:putative baseplate assembly protein n=1 Tax=Nostoc sp. NMS9 TaxID=2815393 RepID=UPI003457D28B
MPFAQNYLLEMDFDFLPKLPKSNLDDRTFKDLVEECVLRIPRYCPEWTNHNPGDPGITLIELFAWLTDQMLLRFNQVPRRNYVAFLELLGIRLNPPTPARCSLTFYLSRAQPSEVRIPVNTEVATIRTETEEAVIFTTDRELVIGNPQFKHLLTADIEQDTPQSLRDRTPANNLWHDLDETLLFDQSMTGNCFYLVLEDPENSIEGNVIAINFKGEAARTTGINPDDPPRKWEAWNGKTWQPILRSQDDDKTKGFSFSEIAQPLDGADVVLHLPQVWPKSNFGTNYSGHWIRCVYTINHEAQPSYSSSPSIVGLTVRAIGGAMDATQCIRITEELLGLSNGKAGQVFELRSQPVLERNSQLREYIQLRLASGEIEDWVEVPDFAESGAENPHYTINSQTGTVQFGPLIREPGHLKQSTQQRRHLQQGSRIVRQENSQRASLPSSTTENTLLERQYGRVPPLGSEIYMLAYRTGGGSRGNVQAGKITIIKNSIPYVKNVINYEPACGGSDAESLDEAVIRVPSLLRTRESALIPEDFERLAIRAATGAVARAHCLTKPEHTTAGIVRLLIVPNKADTDNYDFSKGMKPEEYFALSDELITEILDYMSDRKPLGVQIKLESPEYVGVSVETEVILEPKYNNPRDREEIRSLLLSTLYRFLNPLVGGLLGKGWELGRPLYPSDIFAVCQQIPGVRYLGAVKLYGLRKFDTEWFRADIPELEIDPGPLGMICSWEDENPQVGSVHQIEFRD